MTGHADTIREALDANTPRGRAALAALAALERERDRWRADFRRRADLANRRRFRVVRLERRVQELEDALRFALEAAEEVLELEEPAAEVADVASSAARAVADRARAALAGGEATS